MIKIAIMVVMSMTLSATAGTKGVKVIYGEDNRKDIFEVSNPLFLKLAKSTAAMVDATYLSRNSDGFSSRIGATLETGLNVCAGEKFSNQPVLSSCSGFLVGKDTIVTAGHCYDGDTKLKCAENVWVFDYKMQNRKDSNIDNIKSKNVYKCKSVVKQVFNGHQDFAVIKLERVVTDRKPLKFRKSGKISTNAKLVVIGHPSMLPLKISDGGTVINNRDGQKFITSLDTFQGNSGSAVFDSKTGLLEGILVSGKTDYVPSNPADANSCEVVNVCDMNGKNCIGTDEGSTRVDGEAVTRITTLTKYINL